MDHPAIEDEDVIERYLRGELSPDEALAFEHHYLHCPVCLEQLEMAESFAAALKHTAAHGLLDEAPPPAATLVHATWRFGGIAAPPSRWLALAALLLAACGLPLFLGQQRQSRADAEAAGLRQQLAAERVRASQAEDAESRLSLQVERQAERLAEQAAGLAQVQAKVQARMLPVFLGALRGVEGGGVEVHVSPELDSLLLVFELSGEELPEYRLRLLRQGEEQWRDDHVRPGDLGLVVAIPRALLLEGAYRLEIVGKSASGERAIGRPAFQVRFDG